MSVPNGRLRSITVVIDSPRVGILAVLGLPVPDYYSVDWPHDGLPRSTVFGLLDLVVNHTLTSTQRAAWGRPGSSVGVRRFSEGCWRRRSGLRFGPSLERDLYRLRRRWGRGRLVLLVLATINSDKILGLGRCLVILVGFVSRLANQCNNVLLLVSGVVWARECSVGVRIGPLGSGVSDLVVSGSGRLGALLRWTFVIGL